MSAAIVCSRCSALYKPETAIGKYWASKAFQGLAGLPRPPKDSRAYGCEIRDPANLTTHRTTTVGDNANRKCESRGTLS